MKLIYLLPVVLLTSLLSCAQTNVNKRQTGNVGGPCEGCEAIYECATPFDKLQSMTRLPGYSDNNKGIKIAINGTVYKADGKPAPDVIVYIYHTDQTGVYPTKGDEVGWAKRHGYIRGWMKTDKDGFYKFWTMKPAPYPGRKDPAHIHMTIKEPGKNEYWVDEIVFEDDPLVTEEFKSKCENRGGTGILIIKPYFKGKEFQKSERNIYLGKNIPAYPASQSTVKK